MSLLILAVFGIVAIICIIVVLLSAWRRAKKDAKRSDRYRDAYIRQLFMQDQMTGQLPLGEQVPQDNRIESGTAVDQGDGQVCIDSPELLDEQI